MTAPFARKRLQAIAQRGQVHVFDPRRTETAQVATAHHAIRPGTDALALLALLHVVFAEGAPKLGHLADGAAHLDRLQAWAADFPPERVAGATGVPADTLRALARRLLETPRAAVYGRMGACTQAFGGVTAMLLYALNAVTGHLDTPGGLMFAEPAVAAVHPPFGRPGAARNRFGRWHSRVRGLPEFFGELPVATLAEDILAPGDDATRGLVLWAGNPVLSCPNGRRLDEALTGLDFMVAVDLYRTETNRHAHLLLPAAPPLSRDHYDLAFNLLAVRNHAKFAPAVLPAPDETRQDWQIAHGLQRRLEARAGASLAQRAATAALGRLGPRGVLDLALRAGPYGARTGLKGLALGRLKANPHGVDLGALRPCLRRRMAKGWPGVDLCPDTFADEHARLSAALDAPAEGLVLIGRRLLRSNNSWLHNSPRLLKGKDRCTVLIHPEDAAARGIEEGAAVEIESRVGRVQAPAELSTEVMPGVVSLP
ncbi:MAG: molybdopterin-dependent oxidoreductase, partial [Myxococcales bacterium]|nr:molybdopterin-dependent oxidoreductase [Myxococcales bacterium]